LLPEIKILFYIVFIISLFFVKSLAVYSVFFIGILILLLRVPFKSVVSGWIPVGILLVFTFLGNLLFHQGRVIHQAGPLLITEEGIDIASLRTMRLFFMIAGAKVLTATTGFDLLIRAFANILSPFERIGVPVSEFFSTMGLTLKSLPKLKAQIGEAYREGMQNSNMKGFWDRAKALSTFLVPLFIRTIRDPESFFKEDERSKDER